MLQILTPQQTTFSRGGSSSETLQEERQKHQTLYFPQCTWIVFSFTSCASDHLISLESGVHQTVNTCF